MGDNNFFRTLTCPHCGNISNMIHIGQFREFDKCYDPDLGGEYEDSGNTTWVGLRCHACANVSIVSYYWHDGMDGDEDQIQVEFLYPTDKGHPQGLPPKILNAYMNAEKAKRIEAHLYAVAVGRLLELVCNDKGAIRHNKLEYRLKDLYDKREIPHKLIDVADGIKHFRNIGAHAGLVELTEADIPLVDNLCKALLEYLYSAPYLATQAENSLDRIRAKAAASKKKQ